VNHFRYTQCTARMPMLILTYTHGIREGTKHFLCVSTILAATDPLPGDKQLLASLVIVDNDKEYWVGKC
jgi:hypothetical protein